MTKRWLKEVDKLNRAFQYYLLMSVMKLQKRKASVSTLIGQNIQMDLTDRHLQERS